MLLLKTFKILWIVNKIDSRERRNRLAAEAQNCLESATQETISRTHSTTAQHPDFASLHIGWFQRPSQLPRSGITSVLGFTAELITHSDAFHPLRGLFYLLPLVCDDNVLGKKTRSLPHSDALLGSFVRRA